MSSFTEYLQASVQELQTKVTWPSWRELQESAVLVFVASLLIAFIAMNAIKRLATKTKTADSCNSRQDGQVTLVWSSWTEACKYSVNEDMLSVFSTGGRARTCNQWFWRPLLYQLSYARRWRKKEPSKGNLLPCIDVVSEISYQSRISVTWPAPTVRPPSRMAKRRPLSIAIGAISFTSMVTLSPGITISRPASNEISPVTSVVRK